MLIEFMAEKRECRTAVMKDTVPETAISCVCGHLRVGLSPATYSNHGTVGSSVTHFSACWREGDKTAKQLKPRALDKTCSQIGQESEIIRVSCNDENLFKTPCRMSSI